MSTSDTCKESASKSKDGVCELSDMLKDNSMMVVDKDDVSVCANCGKEGSDVNNICNKCKVVKYCNATCKKKHRHKHEKECEEHIRLAAERAAKLHDEELFKQPPPAEDCPICFLRMPTLGTGFRYMACCGKVICSGCDYAPVYDNQGNIVAKKCPYCRAPASKSQKESIKREKKRVDVDDPVAIYNLGNHYRDGTNGFPQYYTKALELWHRAGELGYAMAYSNIGYTYETGRGVEVDKKKVLHYWELGAMRGCVVARNNLGVIELCEGNMDRALKHYIITVEGGDIKSLDAIKRMYLKGDATKDDYSKALQLYQTYLGEIKSVQRDKAAAFSDEYRYY